MQIYPLDSSTELTLIDGYRFAVKDGGAYWNFQSAFGGWALALGFAAIEQAHPQSAMLAGATATFMKPLPQEGLEVSVRSLREGRRTSFQRSEFSATGSPDELIFAGDYVFSDMKEKPLDYSCDLPVVTPIEDAPRLPDSPGPKFLSRYEQRVALGQPFSAQERPHSAFWVRDAAGRPWDAKALLAVSDTPMPRTFFLDPTPRFGATVQYDLQIFCTREELAELGSEFLLIEATSDRVRSGRFSAQTRIWSQSGNLLAISNQIAFY